MRWSRGDCPHKVGETMVDTHFLLIPVCINGECRWLETASILKTFHITDEGVWEWTFTKWVD